jgi:hypothetical protein
MICDADCGLYKYIPDGKALFVIFIPLPEGPNDTPSSI